MPDETPEPAPAQPDDDTLPGGVNIRGRNTVSVGGDVAGRDVVKSTTRIEGFSAEAVQRLVITVGVLVFVTAACFFSGGIAVGGALAALLRPVPISMEAANMMQSKLGRLTALPPGQPFRETFTEEEVNSYLKFIAGPQIGLAPDSGEARLLENNQVLVAGQLSQAGNLKVAAIFAPQANVPGEPLRLTTAAVQILPLGDSSFGWVALPTPVLQVMTAQLNALFGRVTFTSVESGGAALTVSGRGQ